MGVKIQISATSLENEDESQRLWNVADNAIRTGRMLAFLGIIISTLVVIVAIIASVGILLEDSVEGAVAKLGYLILVLAFIAPGLAVAQLFSLSGYRGELHGRQVQREIEEADALTSSS